MNIDIRTYTGSIKTVRFSDGSPEEPSPVTTFIKSTPKEFELIDSNGHNVAAFKHDDIDNIIKALTFIKREWG